MLCLIISVIIDRGLHFSVAHSLFFIPVLSHLTPSLLFVP